MAHKILDRVQETTTSNGSGALTLAGATTSMLSFSAAGLIAGDTFWGLLEHASATEWEIALCTYNGSTITRAAPLKSSTGAAVAFSAGTKTISLVAPAAMLTQLGTLEAVAAPAIAAGALTLDLATASVFKVANNGDVTSLSIANVLAPFGTSFSLELTADGTLRTWTWPGTVTWLRGAPTLTSTNGKRDLFAFVTFDGGATWLAADIAQNY